MKQECRGKGIGKAFFAQLARIAQEKVRERGAGAVTPSFGVYSRVTVVSPRLRTELRPDGMGGAQGKATRPP